MELNSDLLLLPIDGLFSVYKKIYSQLEKAVCQIDNVLHLVLSLNKIVSFVFNSISIIALNTYEPVIRRLEHKERCYIKKEFQFNLQKDLYESKLQCFSKKEKEFQKLQEETGAIIHNGEIIYDHHKENEIIILHAENSNLKKQIIKIEQQLKSKDKIEKEHILKNKKLKSHIEYLNKKLFASSKIKNVKSISTLHNSINEINHCNSQNKINKTEGNYKHNLTSNCFGNSRTRSHSNDNSNKIIKKDNDSNKFLRTTSSPQQCHHINKVSRLFSKRNLFLSPFKTMATTIGNNSNNIVNIINTNSNYNNYTTRNKKKGKKRYINKSNSINKNKPVVISQRNKHNNKDKCQTNVTFSNNDNTIITNNNCMFNNINPFLSFKNNTKRFRFHNSNNNIHDKGSNSLTTKDKTGMKISFSLSKGNVLTKHKKKHKGPLNRKILISIN